MGELLPIHGFVLAGGRSSRMGVDKAMLPLHGRPMVEIAAEKLRGLCTVVSIVGNRDDLVGFAPVVTEERLNCGPGAGVEAGLKKCTEPWALFVPVDVPLVPVALLRLWCEEALQAGMSVSYLGILHKQPVFCLLQRERSESFTRLLDDGERRLEALLNRAAAEDGFGSRMYSERDLYGYPNYHGPDEAALERWFANVNTPDDLERVRAY